MNLCCANTVRDNKEISARQISVYEVERLLRHLKNTAPGNDNIPVWVLRSCSIELVEVIAHIINSSFSSGVIPSSWRTSIITPIPKVSNPNNLTDFRPISVTPILSRLTEKLLVQKWLKPALPIEALRDQYAYK
jgi:hypothetical protein